jgi:hypothetical protein
MWTFHTNEMEGRILHATNEPEHSVNDDDSDADVPEEIETVLEALFQGLQDRVGSRCWTSEGCLHTCAVGYGRTMVCRKGCRTDLGTSSSGVHPSSRRYRDRPVLHSLYRHC